MLALLTFGFVDGVMVGFLVFFLGGRVLLRPKTITLIPDTKFLLVQPYEVHGKGILNFVCLECIPKSRSL